MDKSAHIDCLPLIEKEHALLAEVADGSIPAYARLYNLYLPLTHQYIAKFLNFQKADIEEVAQDVFLKIWKRKETLITINSFERFLYTIAKNTVIDFCRSKNLRAIKQKSLTEDFLPNYPADENLLTGELFKTAREALGLLPEKRRFIFELRTQEDLSLEEIALKTGMSIAGVHHNIKKATAFICEYLKKQGLEVSLLIIFIILSSH